MEYHQQVVQLAVQIPADGDLLRDGCRRLIQIGQPLQPGGCLTQDSGHVFGVQSIVLFLPEILDQRVDVLLLQRKYDVRASVSPLGSGDSLLGHLVRLVGEFRIEGI